MQKKSAPVLRVETPKPNGEGMRPLGIPTALDGFIEQAVLQELIPIFDPHFSHNSYGFRSGRGCHYAIRAGKSHEKAGYRFVMDTGIRRMASTSRKLEKAVGFSTGWG